MREPICGLKCIINEAIIHINSQTIDAITIVNWGQYVIRLVLAIFLEIYLEYCNKLHLFLLI